MFDLQRLPAIAAAPLAAFVVFAGPAAAANEPATGLGAAIRGQLVPCWNPPKPARSSEGAVRLRFMLKRDGSLDGEPAVLDPSSRPADRAAAAAAVRAVRRCTPLELPQERYDEWRDIVINFDPSELF